MGNMDLIMIKPFCTAFVNTMRALKLADKSLFHSQSRQCSIYTSEILKVKMQGYLGLFTFVWHETRNADILTT